MKICPRCSETFPDDSAFCVHDATPLRKMLDPLLGKTIAQSYRLLSRLAVGHVSSVYMARHVMIERLSAIKILRADLAQNPAARDRFLREARAVNRINHENIVEITDYGEANGLVFLVMEYVAGESLRRQLARGPMPWQRVLALAVQITSALGRAHQMGVIHRDLRPENVLLLRKKADGETAKIIDFGSAKMVDVPSSTPNDHVFGAPGYVAPEYFELGRLDARSDLFALGALLYEAIAGRLPPTDVVVSSKGKTPASGHDAREAPVSTALRALAPDIPRHFASTIMRLLNRRPEDRPRDAFLVGEEWTRIVEGHGVSASLPPIEDPNPTQREPVLVPKTTATSLSLQGLPLGSQATVVSEEAAPQEIAAHQAKSSRDSVPFPDEQPVSPSPAASPNHARAPASIPDMSAVPFENLEPLCQHAFRRLEEGLKLFKMVAPRTQHVVSEARRLLTSLSASADAARDDQARIVTFEARGREFKSNFGRAFDELGKDASRAYKVAEQIQKRATELEEQRKVQLARGEKEQALADVLLWEQAALDEEGRRARIDAEDVAYQIETLQNALQGQSDALDKELTQVRGSLEGHVAALRTLAVELWSLIDEGSVALGIGKAPLAPRPVTMTSG